LIDGGDCGVDVQCEGSTTLLLMDPQAFGDLLATEAEFRLGVLKWLCASHHQVALLKFTLSMPMPTRLHAWLDALVRLSGRADGPWTVVPMALSQAELGATLSTTRQYVAKALNELESSGALVRLHGDVRIRRDALPLAARGWAPVDAMAEPGWQGAGAQAGPSAQSRIARESAR
jgi:CRP-like cAMP-binding protein